MPTVRLIDADMSLGALSRLPIPEPSFARPGFQGPVLLTGRRCSKNSGGIAPRRHLRRLIEALGSSVNALRRLKGRCGEFEKTNKVLMRLNFSSRTVNGWSATG